jgi:membrane protein
VVDGAVGSRPAARWLSRAAAELWGLTVETTRTCFRYRVTGLAAEAGFFALLSLPPLLLGLVGSIGYFQGILGADVVADVQNRIIELSRTVLSDKSVQETIVPTLQDVFRGGRFDLVSVGFVLALWSGSRALNVYVDTITIMYGLSGRRGIIRTRLLSFTLYLVGLLLSILVVPLVLAGPALVDRTLPSSVEVLNALYWPVVVIVTVVFLTSLYHVAVPVRSPWWRDTPGALLALVFWIVGSGVLRFVIQKSVGGPSIYGPLATPIVVLIWLYVLAIAVLIGAALNAAIDRRWPDTRMSDARERPKEFADENPLTPLDQQR